MKLGKEHCKFIIHAHLFYEKKNWLQLFKIFLYNSISMLENLPYTLTIKDISKDTTQQKTPICKIKSNDLDTKYYSKRSEAWAEVSTFSWMLFGARAFLYWSIRPVAITIFTHVVRPSICMSFCLSVSLSVPKLQYQSEITAGRDCELAEWIIDDPLSRTSLPFQWTTFSFWPALFFFACPVDDDYDGLERERIFWSTRPTHSHGR